VDKEQPSVLRPSIDPALDMSDSDLFWQAHWKKFAWALAAVVFLILATGAWTFWTSYQQSSAEALLSEASTPEQWQQVATQFPGTVPAGNASLLLAQSLREAGDLEGAGRELEALLAAQPRHPLAGTAWLTLGGIYQLQGDAEQALEAYRTASGRFTQSYAAPLALVAEGRLLAVQGAEGEARAVLQSVGALYPDTPAAMVAAGEMARWGSAADSAVAP
jgi:TolA-binding protein